MSRQAAFTEASAFIRDASPATGLLGLPRSGKTRALMAKAEAMEGRTYIWASGSGAMSAVPGDVRFSAGGLSHVVMHAYKALGSPRGRLISALECADPLFARLEPAYGDMAERLMPFYERYLQQGRAPESMGRIIGSSSVAGMADALHLAGIFDEVTQAQENGGAVTVWGACQAVMDELVAGADYAPLLDGATAVLVDDAQLLWPIEVDLLMAFIRAGARANITIGQIQSQAANLGRIGAKAMVERWKVAGKSLHQLPYARWVGEGHVALYAGMNHKVRGSFQKARDQGEKLDLTVVFHEEIQDAVAAISASVESHLAEGGVIGDVGIFCGDRDWINQFSDHFSTRHALDIRGAGYGMSSPAVAAAHGVAAFHSGHGGLACGVSWMQLWLEQEELQLVRDSVDMATWGHDSPALKSLAEQSPAIEEFRRAMEGLSAAGPDGIVDTLRGAPLWPAGVAPFESAIDAWAWWAERLNLLGDQWDKEAWATWLLVTPPWLPPSNDRLSVIAHDEPFTRRFSLAHVVGFSKGIFPPGGHPRGSVDGNFAQVANAVSGRLSLHHVRHVNLTGIGEVELSPSRFIHGLSDARVVGEPQAPDRKQGPNKGFKFTMRPKGR